MGVSKHFQFHFGSGQAGPGHALVGLNCISTLQGNLGRLHLGIFYPLPPEVAGQIGSTL